MNELKIIKAALSRESFDKCELVDVYETLSPTGQGVYAEIQKYYARDPEANNCSLEIIQDILLNAHSKNEIIYKTYLEQVSLEDVSEENVSHLLLTQAERAKRLELAGLLANDSSPEDKITEGLGRLAELRAGILGEDSFVGRLPITELFRDEPKPYRLVTPNMDLLCKGGAEEQNHVLIYARPESGKTATALTLCRRNCFEGRRVLYVSNEDADKSIQRRAICNWTNLGEEQLRHKDPMEVEDWLVEHNWENIIFVSGDHQRMASVEALIRSHKPDIVLIDQIRNMHGDSSMTVKLDTVGRDMRRLAKVYNIMTVSITQAGESGSNKLFLNSEDIEWSNTGLQGSVDIQLGVGIKEDNRFQLGMNITKNKTGGGHGSWTARLLPAVSRVTDEADLRERI